MSAETPTPEIAAIIVEAGGQDMLRCLHCGTCSAVCPWPAVKRFSPRMVMRLAALGLSGYEEEDIWTCVTCGACLPRCPRQIDVVEVMRAARAVLHESDGGYRGYRAPLGSLRSDGNPWAGDQAARGDWAEGLDTSPPGEPCEDLLHACCSQAYDPRNRRVARALVSVLQRAGLGVGLLADERCCGEQARKVGAEELAVQLAEFNAQQVAASGARRLITASPHCLQVFDQRSPAGQAQGPQVLHHTRLLADLLEQGALKPARPLPLKVTYHDPCYLGRHAGEYDAPRQVLAAIDGLELTELPASREESLCCGGGGGGVWRDVPQGERFAALRVEQARRAGAAVLATACPHCITMLEDSVKVAGLEDCLEVLDVVELLARALDPQEPGA